MDARAVCGTNGVMGTSWVMAGWSHGCRDRTLKQVMKVLCRAWWSDSLGWQSDHQPLLGVV
jgi:hypothetical protein